MSNRASTKRNCNIRPSKTQIAGSHLSIYEILYKQLDPTGKGSIPGITAAKFLKKSGLKESLLHKIWSLADYDTSGTLDKKGFFIALKLIACAQNEVVFDIDSLDEVLVKDLTPPIFETDTKPPPPKKSSQDDPKPKTNGSSRPPSTSAAAPSSSSTSTSSSSSKPRKSSSSTSDKAVPWLIKKEEKAKYDGLFKTLNPKGGPPPTVSGDKIRPFLVNTKLDVKVLAKIWDFSDIDKDGALDSDEFAMTMHLVQSALKGDKIPAALPLELVPPSKRKAAKRNGLPIQYPEAEEEVFEAENEINPLQWVVSDADKKRYDQTFKKSDEDKDGYVNGTEIKGVFLQSGLPQPVLAHIWNLADADSSGKLDHEQFALAMWLVKQTLSGKEPPKKLTSEMIPPSLRDIKFIPGFEEEQAEIAELKAELDTAMKERKTLNESVDELVDGIQTKKGDVKRMESDLVVSSKALGQLEKQHKKAQETLDELDAQLEELTKELEEASERAALEKQRQDREEALIEARADLKEADLKEVEYETKIEAAKKEITLRTSQEEKVKEEMTNLKTVQELLKDRHKKLANIVVQFTAINTDEELPEEIPCRLSLSPIEDPPTPVASLVIKELVEKENAENSQRNNQREKKTTRRTYSRDSTMDEDMEEGVKPERPRSFQDSPTRPSSGPSKSSLPPARPSAGPVSPSSLPPSRPSAGPPSPGVGPPRPMGPPSPGFGLGPSRPSMGPPSPIGPPKRPSGPPSGRSSPVPDWDACAAPSGTPPSRPCKPPSSPAAAAKPEDSDPFSCLFMPPSKNSAGNTPI